jgi:hypothetical protein
LGRAGLLEVRGGGLTDVGLFDGVRRLDRESLSFEARQFVRDRVKRPQ